MASDSRMRAPLARGLASLVCSFGIVALALGFAPGVQAAPQPTIAGVTAQLQKLGRQNEQLSEQYNKVDIDVATKQKQADRAAAVATAAHNAYLSSQHQVRQDIIEQYKGGGLETTAALLSSQSSQNYLDQLSTLSLISSRRVTITAQLKAQKVAATRAAATAKALFAQATNTRRALAAERVVLTAQVAKYTQLLSHLNAVQRAKLLLIAQAKLKAVAQAPVTKAQRDAQLKVAATITATDNAATTKSSATTPSNGTKSSSGTTKSTAPKSTGTKSTATKSSTTKSSTTKSSTTKSSTTKSSTTKSSTAKSSSAGSGSAAVAVKFALAQIGKPYQFAAAGPRAYDCSGLTMAAWAKAGVHLPHLAAAQYRMGHHVSKSQLRPGDLVFFYSGISHVAMYIGNGMVVHAPHTGDVVRIAPLSEFGSDYVGATRLS